MRLIEEERIEEVEELDEIDWMRLTKARG